jgi:integrase
MTAIPLRAALGDYFAVRRALGFKLTRDGLLLGQFVSFLEEAGASTVTTELALSWTTSPAKQSPSWLAMRLSIGWLPPRRRTTPYLYTEAEIAALMAAARRARWPLSAATYETLIGLLAVTGMRVGEAIRLDRADLLLDDGLLSVRGSKFDQSRMVPIHPSTVGVLRDYLERRRVLSPLPSEPSLFVHPAGNRVRYESVQAMFRALARRAGVEARSDRCRPTVHGLRHTFAVNTLVSWYREGADVQARLPQLSTFLGHADVKWTYWYLSASPELLSLAADRLEAATGGRR